TAQVPPARSAQGRRRRGDVAWRRRPREGALVRQVPQIPNRDYARPGRHPRPPSGAGSVAMGDRWKANATARAIQYVIAMWIAAGIDRDSNEEVLAVTGGRGGKVTEH